MRYRYTTLLKDIVLRIYAIESKESSERAFNSSKNIRQSRDSLPWFQFRPDNGVSSDELTFSTAYNYHKSIQARRCVKVRQT